MTPLGETKIFLRDDDAGELTPALRNFMDTFSSRKLPVSYQVIPQALTPECGAFLKARKIEAPSLYEYGQHGLSHEMTVGGRRVFYEFGPERDYATQLEVIREGRDLLTAALGEAFDGKLFTPPRHRYDRNTLKALKSLGAEILSASSYPGLTHQLAYGVGRGLGLSNLGRGGVSYHGRSRPDSGLFELSISVSVDDGVRKPTPPAYFIDAIAQARRRTPVVGLMFHHHAYKSPEDVAFLSELADRLAGLEGASFHLLSDLAKAN